MKVRSCLSNPKPARSRSRGFTLMEVLVAMGVSSVVLASVASMALYGTRTSMALVNYSDLDGKSRYAADILSREVRGATSLVAFQTNQLTFTNSMAAVRMVVSYDPTNRVVTLAETGQPTRTLLTECDRWLYNLYQRTPLITATNITFFPSTNTTGVMDPSLCKVVSLSWKCSRTLMRQKSNTESVQAAQIVLRNKQ